MGLSTLTQTVFILRESLSIWPRYGISNFQKAGLFEFAPIEGVKTPSNQCTLHTWGPWAFWFYLVEIGPHSWTIRGFERCKMWHLAVLWPRSSQLWLWTFHWLLTYTSCSLWCSLSYCDVLWAHLPPVFEIRGTKLFHLSINISRIIRAISEIFLLSSSSK